MTLWHKPSHFPYVSQHCMHAPKGGTLSCNGVMLLLSKCWKQHKPMDATSVSLGLSFVLLCTKPPSFNFFSPALTFFLHHQQSKLFLPVHSLFLVQIYFHDVLTLALSLIKASSLWDDSYISSMTSQWLSIPSLIIFFWISSGERETWSCSDSSLSLRLLQTEWQWG